MPADAVVATDTASADADRDNGAVALCGTPRYGRQDGRAAHRMVDEFPTKKVSVLIAWSDNPRPDTPQA